MGRVIPVPETDIPLKYAGLASLSILSYRRSYTFVNEKDHEALQGSRLEVCDGPSAFAI